MKYEKTEIILGPPGTGKTTRLLEELDKALNSFSPETICYISFTRKAANEAADRACEKFKKEREEFPLFRTMHSLAYEYLSIQRSHLMLPKDYFALAKAAGTFINFKKQDGISNPEGMAPGNQMLAVISRAKNNNLSLGEAWEELGCITNYQENLKFSEIYNNYKATHNKMDFDDIIIEYAAKGTIPRINILFIDEAQDLSTAQWKMATRLQQKTIKNYVAGDDDQSIYEWAGANTKIFIDLQGKETILNQSFRVPSKVHTISQKILERIKYRREKEYLPKTDNEGNIKYISDTLNLPLEQGTWLLLARNNSFLPYYEETCQELGHFFKYQNDESDLNQIVRAVAAWKSLKAGGICSGYDLKAIYKWMKVVENFKYGYKKKVDTVENSAAFNLNQLKEVYGCTSTSKDWEAAMLRIPDKEKSFIKKAYSSGNPYDTRITISTIHGAKGGEADNVALFLDMAPNTYNAMKKYPDQEHRVWYVGITRTKQNLYLISPETKYHYEL